MQLKNNHSEALGLPNGQVVAPGDTVTIPDADIAAISGNAVLKAWNEKKIVSIEGAPKAGTTVTGAQTGGNEGDERTALMARLDELKVSYDKRSGVAKLRDLVAEAEKRQSPALNGSDAFPAQVEIAGGKTVQLGDLVAAAHTASGLDVEAWNKLSADDRDARIGAELKKLQGEG